MHMRETVMKVVDHKTGSKGTANVVVEKTDHARIALYIDTDGGKNLIR